jgi:hypothetical protein
MNTTRLLTVSGIIGLLVVVSIGMSAAPAAAIGSAPVAQADDGSQTCEGQPQMSRTSITSPQNSITTDDPAVIEANFRVDPTVPEECTIMADLQYTFSQNGFQFAGGSDWEQAASDIATTTFEVSPGEIRSIDAEIYTNGAEAGDEVTVVADYELWYEGDRDNSRQIRGQRSTLTVEEPNPQPEDGESETADDDESSTGTNEGGEPGAFAEFLMENLALVGIVLVALIGVIGLIVRSPQINIFQTE